jgi:2-methylisocitrate lyase-like PEP mutase family enzyme
MPINEREQMLRTDTISGAVSKQRPRVTPLAHDALSARLIEMAGFQAFAIGGSAMLAARFALPDLGLAALGEMAAGIKDIAAATKLPFIADGDDGYGDAKAVAHTVETYEALGVGGILIEDQLRDKKQQRAEKAVGLADEAVIEQKLRTALAVRRNPDTWIIGRTDAYGMLGLDAALRRAERFLGLGVDGVFIAGIKTEQDYERAGKTLKGAFLSAALFEGGDTPWLSPATLGEMGYRHVSFPAAVITRSVAAMHSALAGLRAFADGTRDLEPVPDHKNVRAALDECLNLARWRQLETEYAQADTTASKGNTV